VLDANGRWIVNFKASSKYLKGQKKICYKISFSCQPSPCVRQSSLQTTKIVYFKKQGFIKDTFLVGGISSLRLIKNI
jgi:hypothetical protein